MENINSQLKIIIQEYDNEEKTGITAVDWLNQQIFLLDLSGLKLSEHQKIGQLVSAIKGELGTNLKSELIKLHQDEKRDLTLDDLRKLLMKLTKKSDAEILRTLNGMTIKTDGTVRGFYNEILQLVKTLLKTEGDQELAENLATRFFQARVLQDSLNFQLSKNKGLALVELAEEIIAIKYQ